MLQRTSELFHFGAWHARLRATRGFTGAAKRGNHRGIPAENGVQSDHYRVLAHIYLKGACRGGKDERPTVVAFGRRDFVRGHGCLRAASGRWTPRRTARGS